MKYLKKAASLFVSLLPHINVSMSLFMLTLLITDRFNRAMAFINNDITKGIMFLWCFLIILQSAIFIYKRRRE